MAYDTLEKKRAYSKWYYQTHKAEHYARVARWRQGNRQKIRGYADVRQRERTAKIQTIKLASGCLDCGYRADPVALQFDHVRGQKLFNIGHEPTRTWPVMEAEIAKCEVVCANCHAIRTHKRRLEARQKRSEL